MAIKRPRDTTTLAVEGQAEGGRDHEHRQHERRPHRKAVGTNEDVEDERRRERLGAERQVEHARRPEGEHEADCDEREIAPVGDARYGVVQEGVHATTALTPWSTA
jgi:hypothetical protein